MIDDGAEPPTPPLPRPMHPSAKAVELFQRALEIQAAEASGDWEPKGRRLEYIDIDIVDRHQCSARPRTTSPVLKTGAARL